MKFECSLARLASACSSYQHSTFTDMCTSVILPDGQVIEGTIQLQEFAAGLGYQRVIGDGTPECLCNTDVHETMRELGLITEDSSHFEITLLPDPRLPSPLKVMDGPHAGYLPEREWGEQASATLHMGTYGHDFELECEYELRPGGYYLTFEERTSRQPSN